MLIHGSQQYQIVFSESFLTEDEAAERLDFIASKSASDPQASHSADQHDSDSTGELSHVGRTSSHATETNGASGAIEPIESYEHMILDNRRYLCAIPRDLGAKNETVEKTSPEDEEKELARATDRGRELLQDMDRCIYFLSGWWSYSFCYNNEVKQFHQLPPGNGAPPYPPTED